MRRSNAQQGILAVTDRPIDRFSTIGTAVAVRYTWLLSDLDPGKNTGPYTLRVAHPRELQLALRVILGVYGADPTWRPLPPSVRRRIANRVRTTLGCAVATYVLVESERRIIGACGVAPWHWTGQNFLTDICILPAHRSEVLGGAMLAAALRRLRGQGVQRAVAVTRVGSWSDRVPFRLFATSRIEVTQDFTVPSTVFQREFTHETRAIGTL